MSAFRFGLLELVRVIMKTQEDDGFGALKKFARQSSARVFFLGKLYIKESEMTAKRQSAPKYKQPTKAIIAAAGFGTRFLPQTKATAKEMMPILDKPAIQYIVEDLVDSGIKDIVIVITQAKKSIADHFTRDELLEKELVRRGKESLLPTIGGLHSMANFTFIFQDGLPRGNAEPVLLARHLLAEDEPFLVVSADDVFRTTGKQRPRIQQLIDAYNKTGKTTITLMKVGKKNADKYGMAKPGKIIDDMVMQVDEVIEKPGVENAPSEYGSLLGYLFMPEILPIIMEEKIDKSGEITLADSIGILAKRGGVYGAVVDATYHDTGNQLKYIQAIIDYALDDERFGDDLRTYLNGRLKK